jgi:mono/diheme cytochrome c family protein
VLTIVVWAIIILTAANARSVRDSTEGEALYKAKCSSCHGISGAPTKAGARLSAADLRSDSVQTKSDQQLFDSIAHGTGHKQYPHAFVNRGITEQQIRDVVSYIRCFNRGGNSPR